MPKRTITTEFTTEDAGIETSLRPHTLKEYLGQEKVKNNLKVYIEALVYGGGMRKNRSSILFKKERFMDAIKSLEQECGFIK